MKSEFELLIENRRQHWSQFGLCRGDERFSGRREWLIFDWEFDMRARCFACPVFDECSDWANDPDSPVFDVFAAGEWRE